MILQLEDLVAAIWVLHWTRSSSKALAAPKVVLFEEDEILVLEFGEILPHGVGVLELGFNGVLMLSIEVKLYGLSGVSWEGREVAWKWLQEKWEYIGNTWGSGFLITRFISAVVSPFASFEKAKEVEEFFATRSKPSMARTLKQSIERVHINANWVESIKKEDNLTQLVAQLSSN